MPADLADTRPTQQLAEQAMHAMQLDTETELGRRETFSPGDEGSEPEQEESSAKHPVVADQDPTSHIGEDELLRKVLLLPSIPSPFFGDLIIVLHPYDAAYNCRVDRDRLMRLSVKLNETLERAAAVFTSKHPDGLPYGLVLTDPEQGLVPLLEARSIADLPSLLRNQVSRGDTAETDPHVKQEPGTEAVPSNLDQEGSRDKYARAYLKMLCILHGPPSNDDESGSLSKALDSVEMISGISKFYDVLPLAHRHLRETLHEYGSNAVLIAIKCDPPRWLQLSIALQNFQWFKEAMVHVIGAYDCSIPGWSTYTHAQSPVKVTQLITTTSDTLQRKAEKLISDLMLSTLKGEDEDRVSYDKDYESWIAVQNWQYWLAGELRKVRVNTDGEYRILPDKIGTLLRRIQQGGKACFDIDEEVSRLREIDPSHRWLEYADDMKTLMVYASRTVMYSGLTRSNLELQLDGKMMPVGGEHMVGYLVCAEISKADAPWR